MKINILEPKKKTTRQSDGQIYKTVDADVDNKTFDFNESNIIIPSSKKRQEDIKILSIKKSINIMKMMNEPTTEDVLTVAAKVAAFITEDTFSKNQ